jgi:hypothetical protein
MVGHFAKLVGHYESLVENTVVGHFEEFVANPVVVWTLVQNG